VCELFSDGVHSWDVAPLDSIERRNTRTESLLRQGRSRLGSAVDNTLPHRGESIHHGGVLERD
jgi:hypothetical protein